MSQKFVKHYRRAKAEGTMEYKSAPQQTQQVEDRTVTGIASVFGNVDSGGDVVCSGSFAKTLAEMGDRVRHLWGHDYMAMPTAVIRDLKEIARVDLPKEILTRAPDALGGLLVKREYLNSERGSESLAAITAGAVKEMSYGYNATKFDFEEKDGELVRNIREQRLYETSDVLWGMNEATVADSGKGALPFHETPKADEGTNWDGPTEVAAADVEDLKAMCAWVDDGAEDQKTGYKLPHHVAGGDHAVVWKGVAAAMAALLGSRGGVDIPDGDRRAVYDHLVKHYAQFDKEPPDFKLVELAYTVKLARGLAVADGLKAGRMISAANMEKLRSVIDALEQGLETLEDLIGLAEPPADEEAGKALTDRRLLLARLAIAEREL